MNTLFSTTEKSYFRESLTKEKISECLRSDGRDFKQLRTLESYPSFLNNCNGSTRLVSQDGTETIVSCKVQLMENDSKLNELELLNRLINIDLSIPDLDNSNKLLNQMEDSIKNNIVSQLQGTDKLKVTQKYSFQLFIDILVINCNSYPLGLISLAVYSTLNSTLFPVLISQDDDLLVEQVPQFHDYDLKLIKIPCPITFVVAIFGDDLLLVDPSEEELQTADNCLLINYIEDKKVIGPIRTIQFNDEYTKGFNPLVLSKAFELVESIGDEVLSAL
ncbi:hypothetical protein HANVADRAFT_21423 [Hanseniaspora valbyensis NRRL Y-1626]|uniref:Ribosomal RNA-processing protein 42 n=1 Tax=Hanseniaspora valbyensis NRRL Y-1626 TaxID=766949 RepID=A0A1B7TIX2_9ASCO|nr:hypothetical protein HANVADRAFT_21423 [Hanseniaspora valbyensis NRRL Y-1626]